MRFGINCACPPKRVSFGIKLGCAYGILAAAIIGVVSTATTTVGADLGTLLNKVIDALTDAGA